MACHGGFSLEEATRRSWYNPEEILAAARLQAGMTFADVGSGPGFFSLLAAKIVGEKGKVYAVDADAQAIDRLKRVASQKGLPNIQAVVAKAEDTIFCECCIDIVFYSMVLHDFEDPARVLQNAKTMLKPSGTLVDLDWKKEPMPFGPPLEIRFSEKKASELISLAGLHVIDTRNAGPHHYVVTAKSALLS